MLLNIDNIPTIKGYDKIVLAGNLTKPAGYLPEFPKTLYEFTTLKEQGKLPKLTPQLLNWFWRMVKASLVNKGLGVAAVQIGLQKNMFVIQESDKVFRVYIHPTYSVDSSSVVINEEEACLSVPKLSLIVPRNSVILASWFEFNENEELVYKNELLEGMYAKVFQHETDHNLAISIIDRTNELNRAKKRTLLKSLR